MESYWPDLIYNVRRLRSDTSRFSGPAGQGTACRLPPPHLKLFERLGRGKSGEVLNAAVSMPQSRIKHNVVAKLFLHTQLDRMYNEIHLHQNRLVGLGKKAIPRVYGAFVLRSSRTAVGTMGKWGIIVMQKCGYADYGSTVSVMHVSIHLSFTITIREAAYQCLWLIHQAGVEHCNFHLNNILLFSGGVRVIDFSEAIEHDCSGPDCYELCRARDLLKLPHN